MITSAGIERPFLEMAERLTRVPEAEFAGAVVILPPGDNATPIAFVTSDANPDLIQFLAAVKSRVEIAFTEAQVAAQGQDTWGRR